MRNPVSSHCAVLEEYKLLLPCLPANSCCRARRGRDDVVGTDDWERGLDLCGMVELIDWQGGEAQGFGLVSGSLRFSSVRRLMARMAR